MSHHGLIAEEQRSSTRLVLERGIDVAVIWIKPGDEMLADVHDVSLGGISVYLQDVTDFPIGRHVNLVHLECHMHAWVRHVEPRPEGEFIVGFACERGDSRSCGVNGDPEGLPPQIGGS